MATKKTTFTDQARQMGDEVMELGRNTWLAGLGVVAYTQEETGRVFDRLVTKGKDFETSDDNVVGKTLGKMTDTTRDVGRKVGEGVETALGTVLHGVGVPSRKEIRTLIDRVEKLTEKVQALG